MTLDGIAFRLDCLTKVDDKIMVLEEATEFWARERGLIPNDDYNMQLLKLGEEIYEFTKANTSVDKVDAVGDILVVSVTLRHRAKTPFKPFVCSFKHSDSTAIVDVFLRLTREAIKTPGVGKFQQIWDALPGGDNYKLDCWYEALKVIWDRKGKKVGNDFIKSEDLHG
ncbi:MAG: hypothetical protein RBT33_00905 [Candidatus Dojkabacteria bacterium]|jgi:hypothetical protein|nr:hypothetical protein [Candidatus Dojkabacteria bacterium]MDX9738912.1 hypothetical protein [Candidatus Dojkabacteria bacterium]